MNQSLRFRTLLALFAAGAHTFSLAQHPASSISTLLDGMDRGPHAVGFKSLLLFDTSRTYDLNMGDTLLPPAPKAGRPIVVNVWYPAAAPAGAERMRVRDLFDFPTTDTTALFIEALSTYSITQCRDYCADYYIGRRNLNADTALLKDHRDRVQSGYLDLEMRSSRNAPPRAASGPLVIYHQGLGGSIDEPWMILEHLASYGMVCVSSVFQYPDAKDGLYVGDVPTSLADFAFLIDQREVFSPCPIDHVVLMGHSYGANIIPSYLALGRHDVNSVVLLDNDLARSLVNFLGPKEDPFRKGGIDHLTVPIYCAARSTADFALLDRLVDAPRTYIRVDGMEHDQFTSLGALCSALSTPWVKEPAAFEAAAANYRVLCRTMRKFIQHATGQGPPLMAEDIGTRDDWWFSALGRGEVLAHNSPYDAAKGVCPTPSQFAQWMGSVPPDSAAHTLMRCEDQLIDTIKYFAEDYLYQAYKGFSNEAFIRFLESLKPREQTLLAPFELFTVSAEWASASDPDFRKMLTTRAFALGTWMMETWPDRSEGPMAIVLLQWNEEPGRDYAPYFERILRIEPAILDREPRNWPEKVAMDRVRAFKAGK